MGLCGEIRRRDTGKSIVIPKGFINPNEDTVIEIPVHLDTNSSLIVKAPTDPGSALTVEAYNRAGEKSRGRQQYYEQTQQSSVIASVGTPVQNTAEYNPQGTSFPTASAPVPAASTSIPSRTLNTTDPDYVQRGVVSFVSDPNNSRTATFRSDKDSTLYISNSPQQTFPNTDGSSPQKLLLSFGSDSDTRPRFQPDSNSTPRQSFMNFSTQTFEPEVSVPWHTQQDNLTKSRSSHSPVCPICSQRTSFRSTIPYPSNYSNRAPEPFSNKEEKTKPPFVFINYPNTERYESSRRRSETAILSKLLDEKIDRILKPLLLTLAKSLSDDEREIHPKDSFSCFNQKYLSVKRSGNLLSSSFEMKRAWWMDDDSDDYDKYYPRPKDEEDLTKKSKTNVCTPNVCPSRKKGNVNFDNTDLTTRSESEKRESAEGRRNFELPRRERSFSDLYKKGL